MLLDAVLTFVLVKMFDVVGIKVLDVFLTVVLIRVCYYIMAYIESKLNN
jgi:hypothetical protein